MFLVGVGRSFAKEIHRVEVQHGLSTRGGARTCTQARTMHVCRRTIRMHACIHRTTHEKRRRNETRDPISQRKKIKK